MIFDFFLSTLIQYQNSHNIKVNIFSIVKIKEYDRKVVESLISSKVSFEVAIEDYFFTLIQLMSSLNLPRRRKIHICRLPLIYSQLLSSHCGHICQLGNKFSDNYFLKDV